MFVLGALLPAASAGAIVGGQPDGNGHRYVGFLDASPIRRPSFADQGLTHPRVTFEPVAGTASTWYTGTVYTNPAYDP